MMNAIDSSNGAGSRGGYRDRLVASLSVIDRRHTLTGIRTAVFELGDGPPLILLHGQGEFAATWMQVIPQLAQLHRVIAPDLPGHGASAVGAGALDEERMFAWLDALIDRTCDSPPILAGHLLGGAIAARYAAARRDRIQRLVLVDSLGLAPYRPSPRFALAMIAFVAHPTERTRDRLFGRCFVDLHDVRRQVGDDWEALSGYALQCARSPSMKSALKSLMPKLGMPQIPSADLTRIEVPTTLIWGRHDLQIPLRVAEQASRQFGWPLYVIEDAADDPAVEQAPAFMKAFRFTVYHEGSHGEQKSNVGEKWAISVS